MGCGPARLRVPLLPPDVSIAYRDTYSHTHAHPNVRPSLSHPYSSLPPLWPLLTVYLIWMWFDDAHESGGRKVKWVRRLPIFKYFAEYFPVSLIKVSSSPEAGMR